MKRLALVLTLLSLLVMGGQAFAEDCTIDAVPAATLLVPYFEVDLSAPPGEGVDTLFSVNNASAAPTIAHVSIWSDWSQPVLDFDIFLTGYDAQAVSLYQVFVNGNLPVTADEQSDQGQDGGGRIDDPTSSCSADEDSCSPHGVNPDWDGSFDGSGIAVAGVSDCIDIFPFFVNPLLSDARRAEVQAKLTGQLFGDGCYGADHGDNSARGYVTIDNANACSLIFPNDPGYFGDGVNPGVASDVNQLWGDYFIVDPTNNFGQGDNLVHIESLEADDDDSDDETGYTFYSRYSVFDGSDDNREPLATTHATRYLNGGAFDVTTLTVWRDATINDINEAGFTCGAPGTGGVGPAWHPMNETQVIAFNEAESWEELCEPFFGPDGPPISPPEDPGGDGDPVCFPLETQQVAVGAGDLDTPFNFGWLYLNLNVGLDDGGGADDYDPGENGTLAQSYVSANHSALGRYSVGLPAVQLTSACEDTDAVLFDTGDE